MTTRSDISIPAGRCSVAGDWVMPPGAKGLVIFAHGSGSGRFSPRNRYVAGVLNKGGLGTFLIDLLTQKEELADEGTGTYRFDVKLLSRRLLYAAEWAVRHGGIEAGKIGYFGASTGSAAALIAAAERPDLVGAVVSRGGRPDLADDAVEAVQAPSLFIVGGRDTDVLFMNREAFRRTGCREKKLCVVEGAGHLFEEPGKLEIVARLSRRWFSRYLGEEQPGGGENE